MRCLLRFLPVAAAAGLLLGAAQPVAARTAATPEVKAEAVMPVGYWYDPPPRYIPGPPPRRWHRPPPPVYYAPPPAYYAPPPPRYYYPPPRYYRPPPPPPGIYFRF
jgi:hypothetical protein